MMKKILVLSGVILLLSGAIERRRAQSKIENRDSKIVAAAPAPTFKPDPEVLAFVNAALSQRPWLQINEQWVTGLPLPEQTILAFRREPHIEKQEIDGETIWKVTFVP